jgi:preprotein translocase subunit SecD
LEWLSKLNRKLGLHTRSILLRFFATQPLDPNSLSVSHDQAGRPQIDFEMQGSSIDAFGSFTARNIGEYLTITFDRTVIESAVIESAITGPTVITGNFTQQQANAVAADLKAGSLPVALMVAGLDFSHPAT